MTSKSRVLVTGAASGIGAALTRRLLKDGARVLATDLRLQAVAMHEPLGAQLCALDVTNPRAWESAYALADRAWGGLDILCNVAGYLKPGYAHEADLSEIDRHIDVNLKGVMLGTCIAARRMVSQGSGHIVNIGSLASLAPVAGLNFYSASKFGVRGFSLSVALELKAHNVAVSVVLPDAVDTPMLTLQASYEQAALTFSGSAPLTVDDVVKLIVERVLVDRPIEVAIPPMRGLLARIATMAPGLASGLDPLLRKKGRAKQEALLSGSATRDKRDKL